MNSTKIKHISLLLAFCIALATTGQCLAEAIISLNDKYTGAYVSSGALVFSPAAWVGVNADTVKQTLNKLGYSVEKTEVMGIVMDQYSNDSVQPTVIKVLSSKKTSLINNITCEYKASAEMYSKIYDALVVSAGEPEFQESYIEKDQYKTVTHNERFLWVSGGYACALYGETMQISDAKLGKCGFSISTAKSVANSTMNTAAPTATPRKTNPPITVKQEVVVHSVQLKRTSYGSTDAYIRFKNNSSGNIDRIDFLVKCFDAYGNQIKGYNIYEMTEAFYDNKIVQSGKVSESNYRWFLTGFDGAKEISIAITKYHFTDGKTVTIPESQYIWESFR